MIIKQLTATKGNQTIVERFLEDGTRFIKNIPFCSKIYPTLKEQFQNRNVLVELMPNGWIKIKKMGEDKQLESAARQVVGDKEIDPDFIMNAESDMLKKAGFLVVVEEENA